MDKYEGWPTTRCYPRTLLEAFPQDVDMAEWLYPPEKEPLDVVTSLLWCAGVSMWVGLAYYFAKN